MFRRTTGTAAMALGCMLFLCVLILEAPKYGAQIGSISLRTIVFEPLALATLAWLLPQCSAPRALVLVSRYLLALSLIVFGVDHFLVWIFIANLLPAWIPWHMFWVAFFGASFLATALSMVLRILPREAGFAMGLMFAIWVLTLHLPRVLGLYGIPGAMMNPDEWSSLFIAMGLWGGFWAARV
ncbi:MAG TPA: hypothetical protein VKU19_23370 [Bryobacteraceae bacterium]|nr:hypothetical protein [Bryobacteraceae bacterium]